MWKVVSLGPAAPPPTSAGPLGPACCWMLPPSLQLALGSTCWPLLVLLLPLFPLVQLLESLSCLLQPCHEPLDVIQGTVKDLLRLEEEPGVSHYHPPPAVGTLWQR